MLYPKIYATVIEVRDGIVFAEDDNGNVYTTTIQNRSGYGHSADIVKGLKIKLYYANGRLKFRFVGS